MFINAFPEFERKNAVTFDGHGILVCHSNMSFPNCSGRWKLGSGHSMGLHDRKCGVGSSSPHL